MHNNPIIVRTLFDKTAERLLLGQKEVVWMKNPGNVYIGTFPLT
jgi:hypothetical protein